MMHYVLWGLFVVSLTLLIVLLLRNKYSLQWLVYVGLNIVFAAVLLYVVNWLGAGRGFHLPINIATMSTVGLMGVPGVLLVAALKMTLFGAG